MYDDSSYYQHCPVCGNFMSYGLWYCSDECYWKDKKLSEEQITEEKEKINMNRRIANCEHQFTMLTVDEKDEMLKRLDQYRISDADLTKKRIKELYEEESTCLNVALDGLYVKKWKCEVTVSFYESNLGYNAVEFSLYGSEKKLEKEISIYTSRKDYIALVRDEKKLKKAILAAQNGENSKHFAWV